MMMIGWQTQSIKWDIHSLLTTERIFKCHQCFNPINSVKPADGFTSISEKRDSTASINLKKASEAKEKSILFKFIKKYYFN